MPQFLASPQVPLPAAAASASLTSSTTPWANSSWVEIASSIGYDALLASIAAHSTASAHFEVDIGVGGAGSEVVITTITGQSNPPLTNTGDSCLFPLPILIEAFASGDRIAARVRTSASAANAWTVRIAVVEVPYTGSLLTTANPVLVYPSAVNRSNAPSAVSPAWANGAWVQLVSSTAADIVLVGFMHFGASQAELEIGIGGAGSEVPVGVLRSRGTNGRSMQTMLHAPWDVIPSGSRIAWRHRGSAFAGSFLAAMYIEKPL